MANPSAKLGINEMGVLFTYLTAYRVLDRLSFDLSLARGLDYYTGIIYEAVVEASAPPGFKAGNDGAAPAPAPTEKPKKAKKKSAAAADADDEEIDESQVGVGSIAAGGRYDNLVGMFTAAAAGEGKKSAGLPCVGVSIGLDRIFALLWPKWSEKGMRSKETMAYVMAAGDGLLSERVELVRELREAGIKVCGPLGRCGEMLTQVTRPISSSRRNRSCLPSSLLGRKTRCRSRSSSAGTNSRRASSPSRSRDGSLWTRRRSKSNLRTRARR